MKKRVFSLLCVTSVYNNKTGSESEQPVTQTAKELGVNPNTLYTWIGKYSQVKEQVTVRTDQHLYDELKLVRLF
ncbi:MAG: transposase [Methylococcaceae bacterium]|nr:transposase [Methylococcaceae bacterium]